MRSRKPAPDQVAEVARRRLELLSAELAGIRPGTPEPASPEDGGGTGEFSARPGNRWADPSTGPSTGPSTDRWTGQGTELAPGRHAHRPLGVAATAARWVEDRLPATLQGRARLTGGHLAVVALTVAAGLALTVWWVTRADGDVTTVSGVSTVGTASAGGEPGGIGVAGTGSAGTGSAGPGTAGTGSAGPGTAGLGTAGVGSPAPGTPASSVPGSAASAGSSALAPGAAGASPVAPGAAGAPGSTSGSIVVDVTGKVHRPGIATLPTGSRVVDAIEAAGGAKHGAKLGSLNLARVLSDGEQVVVGLPAPAGVAAPAASAPTSGAAVPMVNVNTATEPQLEELPGVGPVTAAAILDYRTENGPFGSVDALLEVSGIGDATLAKIAPFVTL